MSEQDHAADIWNRIGLAFAKYPRQMDAEERAAREEFMAFCRQRDEQIAWLRALCLRHGIDPERGEVGQGAEF